MDADPAGALNATSATRPLGAESGHQPSLAEHDRWCGCLRRAALDPQYGPCELAERALEDFDLPDWPSGNGATEVERRFWAKVQRVEHTGCWLWTASTNPKGYGRFFTRKLSDDGSKKGYQAHRLAYEMLVGPIPGGLHLDHLCRVRHCVNPAHLEPVTPWENTLRGERVNKTHCNHGHPLDADNIYVYPDGRRECRTCRKERSASSVERALDTALDHGRGFLDTDDEHPF